MMDTDNEKQRPYDEEKAVAPGHEQDAHDDHEREAAAEDVFVEKEEHQIHYKTLGWKVRLSDKCISISLFSDWKHLVVCELVDDCWDC